MTSWAEVSHFERLEMTPKFEILEENGSNCLVAFVGSPMKKNLASLSRAYNRHRQPKVDKKLQAAAETLASRGFLRPVKPYTPPSDAEETLLKICSEYGLDNVSTFDTPEKKFAVLKSCFDAFKHGVPNSILHTIGSVEDLQKFYATPVDTTTPFDALKKMDLPKNMYVQKDYVRFHPDKDNIFNGVSAFPQSSTVVSGLKTRKKYEGYEAKRSWP